MQLKLNGKDVGSVRGGVKGEITIDGLGDGDISLTIGHDNIRVRSSKDTEGKLVDIRTLAEIKT
jgi:hypothetical protein